MEQFENVFRYVVGFDNMSATSYCDLCDSTIFYGDTARVVEDECGVSVTACRKCFRQLQESDR